MTLGVSSVGIANACPGREAIPATPPMMEATFAKDSLREMSVFDFIPENAFADPARAQIPTVASDSFMVYSFVFIMEF